MQCMYVVHVMHVLLVRMYLYVIPGPGLLPRYPSQWYHPLGPPSPLSATVTGIEVEVSGPWARGALIKDFVYDARA